MNQRIQHKIEEYRKMASGQKVCATSNSSKSNREDSLATVIRSKKDADEFMAELESVVKRSR